MASTDAFVLQQEILEKFGTVLDEKLAPECVRLCQMFNLSAEDLLYKWEVLVLGAARVFPPDMIPALKAKCQSDIAKANTARQKLKSGFNGSFGRTRGAFGRLNTRLNGQTVQGTPTKPNVQRQDGLGVALGEDMKVPVAGPSKVKFIGPTIDEDLRKRRAYRYMYEKVYERSTALDRRIDEFGELVMEHYHIEELGDPTAATEEEVTIVGRITLDSETSAGPVKLNEAALTLESSRMMGSGARVPLRFDPNVKVRQGKQGVGGIGLFPGAIVALRGKNGGGGWFSVTEILALPPLKACRDAAAPPHPGSSFSMVVACGPFTPDTDFQYKNWHRLLAKIKAEKPNVMLLLGPFIDAAHPFIKEGEIDVSPYDIFREIVVANLMDFLASSPGSLILIVSSVRDIISDHAVFPQCEMDAEFSSDPRIRFLPNPCRFSLNNVTFGVSSVDVLFHLRKEEFFKRAEEIESVIPEAGDVQPNDAMSNACRHLLQQRSFYPLFPVPLELAHEVNLDVTHLKGLDLCAGEGVEKDKAPEVLITPSRLKHFSKHVDSTVVVNPSFLTKGTFAKLTCDGTVVTEILRLE
ncbi:DNA polymerase alpha, subunit B [Laetiporus sulphureus 93-53]|uniref:DNA polymerase alpha subunit B n=1 Tax=Laetiporus sulphureus 93-53 TaxID=1314785 RepID=A0A165HP20_9APHY|nr:DNA polymerase alpha, subunit B [Laetiporus sulphureus 93-53]KZT11993.1 DNA polymerase alpha, subunit B [Laetiporus sulphureus 93-53]